MRKIVLTAGIMIISIFIIGCKSAPPEPVIMETMIPTPLPTPVPTPVPTPTAEKPYYIEVLPSMMEKNYTINPYSFIHSFYSMVFYDFRLTHLIPLEERKEIMEIIYNEISLGSQVNFVIKKYMGIDKLSFVFFNLSTNRGITCNVKTNWDEGAGVLVPLDMPKEEWKRCVSLFYHLIDSKLIHESNLYSFYTEQTLLENYEYINLSHLYIFDEKSDNDSQVEEILTKLIKRNSGNTIALNAQLELIYFYLLNGNIESAESIITRATRELTEEKEGTLYTEFLIVNEETEVLKNILE